MGDAELGEADEIYRALAAGGQRADDILLRGGSPVREADAKTAMPPMREVPARANSSAGELVLQTVTIWPGPEP